MVGTYDPHSSPLILVIDDDEGNRLISRYILKNYGYDISESGINEDIISKTQEAKPDIILLATGPEKTKTLEICQKLQAQPDQKNIPVIILSHISDDIAIDEAFNAGATDYYVQPLNWSILMRRIEGLLDKKNDPGFLNDSFQIHIIDKISNNTPLSEIFSAIYQNAKQNYPDQLFSIMLVNQTQLVFEGESDLPAGLKNSLAGIAISPDSTTCGAAVYRSDTVVTTDIAKDPSWKSFAHLAKLNNIKSCWAIPLRGLKGGVVGVITCYCREKRLPTDSEINFLQHNGKLAQLAIQCNRVVRQWDYQQYHDAVSGLPNLNMLTILLEKHLHNSQQNGQKTMVFLVELGIYRQVLENLGNEVGNQLFVKAVSRLKDFLKKEDLLARVDVDKVVIIPGSMEPTDNASNYAIKIINTLSNEFTIKNHQIFMMPNIGVSVFPKDGTSSDELLNKASKALNAEKVQIKRGLHIYTRSLKDEIVERVRMEGQLRNALPRNELKILYQPQYEIQSDKLIGFEALLRWHHPELGLILPGKFIHLAEETGFITDIGKWVLKEGCLQTVLWHKMGYKGLRIAINVSPLQFYQHDFYDGLVETLNTTGLNPDNLELELTEGILMQNTEEIITKLNRIRELGVRIALDDFGTGFSSLSYLLQLNFETLKIDKSFLSLISQGKEMTGKQKPYAIVEAIAKLGQSLGLNVVAEGIESQEQYDVARKIKCEAVQGFLLSPPLTVPNCESLLKVAFKYQTNEIKQIIG